MFLTTRLCRSQKKEALLSIPGVRRVKMLEGKRRQLICAADQDIRPQVFEFVKKHDLSLVEMHRESLSVEEVFKKLTEN